MNVPPTFPQFKDAQEFEQFMLTAINMYEDYSPRPQTPEFLRRIIGPPIPKVGSFTVVPRDQWNKTIQGANEYEHPVGMSAGLNRVHGSMGKVAEDIGKAFAPYFHKNVDDELDPATAWKLKLSPQDSPKVLQVNINDRDYQFRHQYPDHILYDAYFIAGFQKGVRSRSKEIRNVLMRSLGANPTPFSSLLQLSEKLEENFIPSKDQPHFEDTGFKFDFDASYEDLARHAEFFHKARLYFYLFMNNFNSANDRFFWKEAAPELEKPIPLHTPLDAACGLIALGQCVVEAPGGNELSDLLAKVSDKSQQLSECKDIGQAAALLAEDEVGEMLGELKSAVPNIKISLQRQHCRDMLKGLEALRQHGLDAGTTFTPPPKRSRFNR